MSSTSDSRPTARCRKYNDGHNVHWIPVLNVYRDTPRHLVTVQAGDPGWFHILDEHQHVLSTHWTHDADRLNRIIADGNNRLLRVGSTQFFTEYDETGERTSTRWLCVGNEPSDCSYD